MAPLFVRELGGEGPSLVVLHGLLGSSRNWISTGKLLAERFRVIALDLPNHGDSPPLESPSFPAMASAVDETIESLGINAPVHLMGHSLGGKVAMRLALDLPTKVAHLWVLDIAPLERVPEPEPLEAMVAAHLDVGSRKEIDDQLATTLSDPALRQFLMTNLARTDSGFAWRVDPQLLLDSLPLFAASPLAGEETSSLPATFIAGGESHYVGPREQEAIRRHFPTAVLHVLDGIGHNVHFEDRERFCEVVFGALRNR